MVVLGLTEYQMSKLQTIQNSAARLITEGSKYDHITPVLYNLHWLPVCKCIEFKVLLLVFKCIHGLFIRTDSSEILVGGLMLFRA